jgi:hypothetical protein
MDSPKLLQPLQSSDLILSLLIIELWLLWTPTNSNGLIWLSLYLLFPELWLPWTHMDSFLGLLSPWAHYFFKNCASYGSPELLQPFTSSELSLSLLILEPWLLWTPMDFSGLFPQAGSVTLFKIQTFLNGLSWTLAASSSFWLELASTKRITLTPMNSCGLLWSFLSGWISYSFIKFRLLWTHMDSAELLQPLLACDLNLSLLILELWLIWTPMDSSGLFSRARSVTLSKMQTLMDSYRLIWNPMESFGLLWTPMDSF